jgi:hypothetical protein
VPPGRARAALVAHHRPPGSASLRDLRLRPDALAALGLPLHVKEGSIGFVEISFPSTFVIVRDVHICVEHRCASVPPPSANGRQRPRSSQGALGRAPARR